MRLITSLMAILLSLPLFAQQTVGLFQNDSLSLNGYTLFAPNPGTSTYLINNCGERVNEWKSDYRPGMSAYLLENGDLLRAAKASEGKFRSGGWGGRLERFDWSGQRVWHMDLYDTNWQQHHDVEWMPNGNILVIAWEKFSLNDAIAAGIDTNQLFIPEIWAEMVLEIQPSPDSGGVVVWEWHAWDHLVQDFDSTKNNFGVVSQSPGKIDLNYLYPIPEPDWLHFNSIAYNPDLDQIMLSVRTYDELWIIDHSTTNAEAASDRGGKSGQGGQLIYRWGNPDAYNRGNIFNKKLYGQHDPYWIPKGYPDAGKIMVYNNGSNRADGNYSTVEIIDPPISTDSTHYELHGQAPFEPLASSWVYPQTAQADFFSGGISGAQRLSNGNTLITEGADGRIFEIDPRDSIVWEYINPITRGDTAFVQGDSVRSNGVFRAYRYAESYPAFHGRELLAGSPVERNPLPSNCVIYGKDTTVVDTTDTLAQPNFIANQGQQISQVYPNPFSSTIHIQWNGEVEKLQLSLSELSGKEVQSWTVPESVHSLRLETPNYLPAGFYVLTIQQEGGSRQFVRLLKE